MTHIMLDLETWGKRPGCDIRSIGAVVFDPLTGWIGGKHNEVYFPTDQFYTATYSQNGYWANGNFIHDRSEKRNKYFLKRDPETVEWWSKQSSEAQSAFENPIDLREACNNFGHWLGQMNDGEATNLSDNDLRIWANGSHFDIPILEAVYHDVSLPLPWHYRAPRDVRTIMEAAGMTRNDYSCYGEAHNALDDAIAQAMTVCEAYKRLGLAR